MDWKELPSPTASPPLPDLPVLVARNLLRRGLTTPEAARAFLDPEAYPVCPATELPGLASAAERVEAAIRSHEPVCVWGDFDVDGQTSTTILVQTLQALGGDVTYHIPIRATESHGVNLPVLTEIIDQGARLVLTCDTGIGAHAAVEYARTRGVDLVITDHHDIEGELPAAAAVTDPKLLPAGHPLSTLSGSGVAYKLAEELFRRCGRAGEASQHVDLAALGLVADLAALTGEARYLVQRGLASLRTTGRLGLKTILELAELDPAHLTEEHIGFVLGPRLNALGRLGDANPAVELFTTSDPARARLLATQLEGLNAQRQLLCSQVTEAAEAQLRADPAKLTAPVLVLGHPAWPGGVVGIVASRLVERYGKPAILFTTPPDGPARGSARSVPGLNITAAIAAQSDLLLNFGGHPMAAGLALPGEKLPEFERRLARTVTEMSKGIQLGAGSLAIDVWIDLAQVDLQLAAAIEQLAPFGPGNEKPILASARLNLQSKITIGRNKEHLKLMVADEVGNSQVVLWWNGAGEPSPEGRFDLAYTVRASDWRGEKRAQMEWVDFRLLQEPVIEVRPSGYEILDLRTESQPRRKLAEFTDRPTTLVWAEAGAKKLVGGTDRNGLIPAETLVIWTSPASREILQEALERVQPRRVILFAATEPVEAPEDFLERLTGLLKFAIQHRQGEVTYPELEAATAQRAVTVRRGLQWLVAEGQINIRSERDSALTVFVGTSLKDPAAGSRLWVEIQALLAESAAYRAYFKRAEARSLLGE